MYVYFWKTEEFIFHPYFPTANCHSTAQAAGSFEAEVANFNKCRLSEVCILDNLFLLNPWILIGLVEAFPREEVMEETCWIRVRDVTFPWWPMRYSTMIHHKTPWWSMVTKGIFGPGPHLFRRLSWRLLAALASRRSSSMCTWGRRDLSHLEIPVTWQVFFGNL